MWLAVVLKAMTNILYRNIITNTEKKGLWKGTRCQKSFLMLWLTIDPEAVVKDTNYWPCLKLLFVRGPGACLRDNVFPVFKYPQVFIILLKSEDLSPSTYFLEDKFQITDNANLSLTVIKLNSFIYLYAWKRYVTEKYDPLGYLFNFSCGYTLFCHVLRCMLLSHVLQSCLNLAVVFSVSYEASFFLLAQTILFLL